MSPFGRGAAAELRRWAYHALAHHSDDGTLPTSLRHLFYEAVMGGVVDKTDKPAGAKGRRSDQNLTDAVTWLRESGFVGWDLIEDRTRHLADHRGTGDRVTDALNELLDNLRIDIWDDVQPVLAVESESVAGVLDRIAYMYRVPIVPTRGQSNGWLRTLVADRLADRPIAVIYLGDVDKAGHDIEMNSRRVLSEILRIKAWERVALTWDQVDTLGLPTVPRLDKRNGVTYEVCEIEALPQRILIDEVTTGIRDWLPADVDLDDVHEREREERAAIRRALNLPEEHS